MDKTLRLLVTPSPMMVRVLARAIQAIREVENAKGRHLRKVLPKAKGKGR